MPRPSSYFIFGLNAIVLFFFLDVNFIWCILFVPSVPSEQSGISYKLEVQLLNTLCA